MRTSANEVSRRRCAGSRERSGFGILIWRPPVHGSWRREIAPTDASDRWVHDSACPRCRPAPVHTCRSSEILRTSPKRSISPEGPPPSSAEHPELGMTAGIAARTSRMPDARHSYLVGHGTGASNDSRIGDLTECGAIEPDNSRA